MSINERRRILVLLAHPAMERSLINRRLVERVGTLADVVVHDLYETYPDFDIDVEEEQQALSNADVVVFQHPIMWYSQPALLRQWQDLVLEHGFAYGEGGRALAGKWTFLCLSTGGRGSDYQPDGLHDRALADYLRPMQQTARFCGMHWLPPFVVYGSRGYATAADVDPMAEDYARLLIQLSSPETDPEQLLSDPSMAIQGDPAHG